MLKKLTPLAIAAGLLGSVLTATEAFAADPAPSGVTIAWKDSSHEFVRVTWTDDGDLPNKVVLRIGASTTVLPVFVAAGAPNVVDYPATRLEPYSGQVRIDVSVGTEAGETSPAGFSPRFDTIIAAPAERVAVTLSGTSGLRVRWEAGYSEFDGTPNDPLDLVDSTRYTPQLVAAGKVTQLAAASPATQVTVAAHALPYQIDVVASNEWGTVSRRLGGASAGGLKAVIPAWVKSGSPTSQPAITGTVTARNAPVYLQARNTATSPWYTASSQQAVNGRFKFLLGASGSRHYRVLVPNFTDAAGIGYFGSYSASVATTVQVNTWGARFTPATVRRGQTATAEVRHSPTCSYAVVLQRWTGKTWSTVGFVRTDLGVARGYVKGAAAGRVAYRYYFPALTLNGYKYAAAYSANFVLTTT
ncbi:hypothetical protein [Kribbella italica]|uniref:Fibronectin type III domain-containing protein n=1 Tax=Kribbella italica TaxID=1540520 RepID=A0A7W9MW62_9ACTN|nr:hypothetical protein [Kribbella italica]MBB5838544.1 hypothetical protein [Kribbella italica]